MATSIFCTKAQAPTDEDIAEAMGKTKELWNTFKTRIGEEYTGVKNEWKFYSKKSGWILVFKKNKRTLFYLVPCKDYFRVFFVFGEKAIDAAKNAHLPEDVLKNILEAPKYIEGTSFDIDVKQEQDLNIVDTLLKIKDEV